MILSHRIAIGLLVILLLAACGGNTPTTETTQRDNTDSVATEAPGAGAGAEETPDTAETPPIEGTVETRAVPTLGAEAVTTESGLK
ncbi:MAG: hypothetical protein ACRDIB_08395, partial [Ardenticatenaceae bacterium]